MGPVPDSLVLQDGDDPAEIAAQRESIRLAFIAALQTLPPPQRAVLIFRDVLCWHTAEVAGLLDLSVAAVNGALQRRRVSAAAVADRGSDSSPVSEQNASAPSVHVLGQKTVASDRCGVVRQWLSRSPSRLQNDQPLPAKWRVQIEHRSSRWRARRMADLPSDRGSASSRPSAILAPGPS